MERYQVKGAHPLNGKLQVHGAKNAALPILAASLLCDSHSGQCCCLHNCPQLSDVEAACNILRHLGCKAVWQDGALLIRSGDSSDCRIPDHLMREMRSSIVFLGAMLAKYRQAHLTFPGGCELGPRPIDMHLAALEKMGVEFTQNGDELDCCVPNELHGASIDLPFPSVGATENVILAASLAKGETILRNGAREPEISDLAGFLNACGGCVHLEKDGTVHISGVERLSPCKYSVIPDRIVGITYLCCGAITGGNITITSARPDHMRAVFPILEEMGCSLKIDGDQVSLLAPQRLKAIKNVTTMPYPGFPTDALAPVMALTAVAQGTTIFTENIFQNRYKQAWELCRMGADIRTEGRIAVVRGVKMLHPAFVNCTDLRGGAALVIAALATEGTTTIGEIRHIQRGYENLPEQLRQVGACITIL